MKPWLKSQWYGLRDTLWFVPAICTTVAALLAIALVRVEERGLLGAGEGPFWVYQGSAQGARDLLSTITGSLITVTGVVFSVTIVAVQLASSQYTPRVLRNFSSDRGNQLVLGIFIGTFTYGMIVLRTVRSEQGEGEPFVPRAAVTLAVLLLLTSVSALIYFINHVAREMRITEILQRVVESTMGNVHRLFPEHIGIAVTEPCPDPRLPGNASRTVRCKRAGYIHYVDDDALFNLGRQKQLVIGMEPKVGDYVLQGRPLASIWSSDGVVSAELEDDVRKAFVLGPERTPQMDLEFGLIQISDIAIKALSPSVNDPTTAIRCIDRLAEILTELGSRKPPVVRRTRDGVVHFIADYTTFDRALEIAYDDIRHFGAPIPLIAEHLLLVFTEITASVPEAHRSSIAEQADAVLHTARESITNPRDLRSVEAAAQKFSDGSRRSPDSRQTAR